MKRPFVVYVYEVSSTSAIVDQYGREIDRHGPFTYQISIIAKDKAQAVNVQEAMASSYPASKCRTLLPMWDNDPVTYEWEFNTFKLLGTRENKSRVYPYVAADVIKDGWTELRSSMVMG